MATDLTQATLSSTYKDDWTESDNYHRILFNSGRALQARELTQVQTIIQEEMARFGGHVFKEGAAVSLGGNHITALYNFVRVNSADLSGVAVGDVYQGQTSGVKATVLEVLDADNTLYIAYIDGDGSLNKTFDVSENIIAIVGTGGNFVTVGTNATGSGVKFTVGEGDFFVAGHFVHAQQQSLILEKYSNTVDAVVGFKVEEKIITVNDDEDLYDNAGDVVNTASPGADRLQINLTLIEKSDTVSQDMFVFIARIENGEIVEEVSLDNSYNELEEQLAQRTREESGNYIVSPFNISYQEHDADASKLELHVDGGLAYVNGHRASTATTVLLVPKPQDVEPVTDESIGIAYGNYFQIQYDATLNLTDGETMFFNAGSYQHIPVNIYIGNDQRGTCILRAIQRDLSDSTLARAYVYKVEMDADYSVSAATSLRTGNINIAIAGTSGLLDTRINGSLFKFPLTRPKLVDGGTITRTCIRSVRINSDGTGVAQLANITPDDYVDWGQWIIWNDTSNTLETGWSYNPATYEISGLTVSQSHVLLYFVQESSTNTKSRPKSLTQTTVTSGLTTVGEFKYLPLGQYDIYEIDSVRLGTSAGEPADAVFRLDNGQRDNYYTEGRLILNDGYTWTGNVYTKFKYFARNSVTSDDAFYSVSSYSGQIDYKDIPTHKLSDGTLINLRDYLDFRPDVPLASNTPTNEFGQPRIGSNVSFNTEYYLPRADKILVDENGGVSVLLGQQAQDPQYKKTPDNSLDLYNVLMNANTLDATDLKISPVEHKRYTMADIAKLEAKLDALAESTSLSLLELDAKIDSLHDSDGNVREEVGIIVDDGSDQNLSDTNSSDYCASVDPDSQLFRPCFDENNIRLIYVENDLTDAFTTANSSKNVVLKGDNVYLDYEESSWITQTDASEAVKVNPYGMVDNVGCMELSPSSDEWKAGWNGLRLLGNSNRLDVKWAWLWNSWQWNWIGRLQDGVFVDPDLDLYERGYGVYGRGGLFSNIKYLSDMGLYPRKIRGAYVNRIMASATLRRIIGNRVVDAALLPWIRSRKIYFKIMGLKPNTLHKAYFDGVDVTNFCRTETFLRYAATTNDDGNLYTNVTVTDGHPQGALPLTSNDKGELSGSFFIPSTRPRYVVGPYGVTTGEIVADGSLRFRAGIKEFKVLDIAENNWSAAGSKAAAYYSVQGAMPIKQQTILSTRLFWKVHPYDYSRGPNVWNYHQIRDEVDNVPAGYVQYLEPHEQGLWGAATTAVSPGSYSGEMGNIIYDYVNVNQLLYSGVNVLPSYYPQKPLAQSFFVDNPFGVILTNIKLYFKTRPDPNEKPLPVSVQIRPMKGNVPDSLEIVPGSCSFVNAADVNVSSDASLATTFEFEEPVFLNPYTKYAICVQSQSTEYEVFTATFNQYIVGGGGRKVTKSHLGDMFFPQTGYAYKPAVGRDLTYQITRAKFSPKDANGNRNSGVAGGHNGSLILRNAEIPDRLLGQNPLSVTQGSSTVYVKHPCHGLNIGDYVTISGAVATGGINAVNLNLTNTLVTNADVHGFTYTAGSSATSTTLGGGSSIITSRNIQYDVIMPYIETAVPALTSVDFSAKLIKGKSFGNTESYSKYDEDQTFTRVNPFVNTSFDEPRLLANRYQETQSISSHRSAYFKVDLKSANNYVSPIVDLQRSSLILVTNCIDDSDGRSLVGNSELSPYGGASPSRHIVTPVSTAIPAVGFSAKVKYICPAYSDFSVYGRTSNAGENIADQPWFLIEPQQPLQKGYYGSGWKEAEFLAGGLGGTLDAFTQAQLKFVMHTSNTVWVPLIKDLKWKFLAT